MYMYINLMNICFLYVYIAKITSGAICCMDAKLCKTTQNSYGSLLKPWKPKENAKSLIFKKRLTPFTNSYEKKSTAEMLLILTILNVISKQNTTNRVDKNDLV